MTIHGEIACLNERACEAYLVKPASTQRGEREAQDGQSVCLIFVCEIRNTLHERRFELAAEACMNTGD
jgi:hypothetical protein